MHPHCIFGGIFFDRIVTKHYITIIVDIQGSTIQGLDPATGLRLASPPVLNAIGSFFERAFQQSAVFRKGVDKSVHFTFAGIGCIVGTEVVVILAYSDPSLVQFTLLCVVGLTILLEDASEGSLVGIQAVFTEVVVQILDFLDTGNLVTIDIVGIAAVFHDPAALDNIDQSVGIHKGIVDRTEAAALFTCIIGVNEGLQAEGFLVLSLLCKGVQCVCTQINIVANLTGVNSSNGVLGAPVCICLRSQLNAVQQAQGVSGFGIDCLGLIHPVQGQG